MSWPTRVLAGTSVEPAGPVSGGAAPLSSS